MATILHRIKNKLVTEFQRSQYMKVASAVLATPALERGDAPFTVLSMVHKRDVIPYLVAVKSFAHFQRPSRVIVVCDPSIEDEDRAKFKRHVPHIELLKAEAFRSSEYPVGGTWERLAAIAQLSCESYVVQLDADTLTIAALDEVAHAISQSRGFVIGETENQTLMTLQETADKARSWTERHIQSLAEKQMVHAGLALPRYVRGCSGFTGFPPSDNMRERMIEFSSRMTAVTKGRWAEWGTEQVTSNYLVANAHGTQVLPYPRYSTPETNVDDIAFFHFIGYVRFVNSLYRAKTKQALGLITQTA